MPQKMLLGCTGPPQAIATLKEASTVSDMAKNAHGDAGAGLLLTTG